MGGVANAKAVGTLIYAVGVIKAVGSKFEGITCPIWTNS
jgi:uncharacterized membrane protein